MSDHLCWSSVGGHYAHDLLPLPYTEEALAHVVRRVVAVQERLGRQILVENVSSYLTYTHSTLTEWEFLGAVAERADCGLLLDVNNVYVSAANHGFSPSATSPALPADRVGQIHLAGHTDMGAYLFDTHDGPVIDPVWDLYREAVAALRARVDARRVGRPHPGARRGVRRGRAGARGRGRGARGVPMLPLRELQLRFCAALTGRPTATSAEADPPSARCSPS